MFKWGEWESHGRWLVGWPLYKYFMEQTPALNLTDFNKTFYAGLTSAVYVSDIFLCQILLSQESCLPLDIHCR